LTIQNSVALVLAWIVDRDVKGGQIYRSIFFLPPILSGIVVGLIWNWIFQGDFGLLNGVLAKIGMGDWRRAWLANPKTALSALAMIHMWRGFGWGFIILLAGLQGIPRELYEAARMDGAGEFRIFWKITVPLMVPVFILVSVLTVLGTMPIYDLVITTTRGGPGFHTEVPMKRIIDEISPGSRLGYACAMGVVLGAMLLVISMIQIQLSKKAKAE
jgi:raffinose/stachyose/melibiose transport system permease protein